MKNDIKKPTMLIANKMAPRHKQEQNNEISIEKLYK